MLNGLDLFSGIGGMSVALSEYVRPVAYCEIDPYCQGVLLSHMGRTIVNAPIWDNITTLNGSCFSERIEIMYGGFPCQDISVAGNGKGLGGERSGLFYEILRLAKEIQPTFIFLENVPAITTRGGLQVVESITEMGYDCRWCVISAASIGALHRRERWFLLAHSSSKRLEGFRKGTISTESKKSMFASSSSNYATVREWQEAVSSICRTSDGIQNRMDRIKSLGNAVVPKQAKEAFEILMGLK